MKIAQILDEEHGGFELEFDNTRGSKHRMRLDAVTYEQAIREAKSFLGIAADGRDADGTQWEVE
jgi:hypothetical protein